MAAVFTRSWLPYSRDRALRVKDRALGPALDPAARGDGDGDAHSDIDLLLLRAPVAG
jgi:hypothetical protein